MITCTAGAGYRGVSPWNAPLPRSSSSPCSPSPHRPDRRPLRSRQRPCRPGPRTLRAQRQHRRLQRLPPAPQARQRPLRLARRRMVLPLACRKPARPRPPRRLRPAPGPPRRLRGHDRKLQPFTLATPGTRIASRGVPTGSNPATPEALAKSSAGPVQQKWALVIGISSFADRVVPKLNYTAADANGFASILADPTVGRFPMGQHSHPHRRPGYDPQHQAGTQLDRPPRRPR